MNKRLFVLILGISILVFTSVFAFAAEAHVSRGGGWIDSKYGEGDKATFAYICKGLGTDAEGHFLYVDHGDPGYRIEGHVTKVEVASGNHTFFRAYTNIGTVSVKVWENYRGEEGPYILIYRSGTTLYSHEGHLNGGTINIKHE